MKEKLDTLSINFDSYNIPAPLRSNTFKEDKSKTDVAKYENQIRVCYFNISKLKLTDYQDNAMKIKKEFGLTVFGFDEIISNDGQMYCIDLNFMPGSITKRHLRIRTKSIFFPQDTAD